MKLLHYSFQPITKLEAAEQSPGLTKPRGLWVSVGRAWAKWCEEESFRLGSVVNAVTLADDANVLRIGNEAGMSRFQAQYGYEQFYSTYIDWLGVARKYDGLIIAPYLYSSRLDRFWYYGWDCASGCIWQPRAVSDIRIEKTDGVRR